MKLYNQTLGGGDDGAAYDIDIVAYQNMVKYFQMDIVLEQRLTSEPLNLLARDYISPQTSTGSTLTLDRMLQRFNFVISNPTISPIEALRMKTESLIITEGNTNPLISSFSDMLLRVLKGTKYVNATAKNYS